MIRPEKYAAATSYLQNRQARIVVVPTITTLRDTFAAMVTYCQNQQEQLAVGPLIIIHLNTYAVALMSIRNRLVLTAVPVGACIVVRTLMGSL
jgi:hypothetical protein